MRTRKVLLGTLAALSISVAALANSVTVVDYDLSHPTGNIGNSHVYGSLGYNLPIYGIETNTAPNFVGGNWNISSDHGATALFGKVTPGDPGETGLGMNNDPNNNQEIWDNPTAPFHFGLVVMDVSQLEANPNLLYFQMQIGSSQQPNELYTIWGSTDANPWSATLLLTGVGNVDAQSGFFDVPNYRDYRYIWVGAEIKPGSNNDHSNVLVDSKIAFSNTPVPEPSTFALLGSGLITAGFSLRKRFAKRT